MAAVTSVSFSAIAQSSDRKIFGSSVPVRPLGSGCDNVRFRQSFDAVGVRASSISGSRPVVHCMATAAARDMLIIVTCWRMEQYPVSEFLDPPTVAETKANFLKAYKKPIPSIYNSVLQELIVQQHLTRYKRTYRYDPVFALGFVTIYDQLMDGYPSDEDREAIFTAYIRALQEDPEQYRKDAQKLEELARSQSGTSLLEFSSREGEVEGVLKDIAERASGKGSFSYSRFFAVGLFRLLELSNASEPTILEKLCAALNISKRSVDRDLDVYRNLLNKLVQAKELLKEYVDREKKKQEERSGAQKANEAVKNCVGEDLYMKPLA